MRSTLHLFIILPFILSLAILGCPPAAQEPDTDVTQEQGQEPEPETEPEGPKVFVVSIPPGTSIPGCEDGDNDCFEPATLEIQVGDTVNWENDDIAAHTITSGSPADGLTETFDSSVIISGTNFEFKFTQVGTYEYYCMVHPWQTGVVEVE